MFVSKLSGSLAALTLLVASPALAQMANDHMAHDAKTAPMAGHAMPGHKMKMSDADHKKMESCNAMTHADAAKDAGCAAMMKAHPEMMNHKPMKKM